MKYSILIIFFIQITVIFAQSIPELDCENGFETIATGIESQEFVSYKIMGTRIRYTKETFEYNEGVIVVSNLNDDVLTNDILAILTRIGVRNKLSKIHAFRTCEAIRIYGQPLDRSPEQIEYLDKNLLPEIQINFIKTLTKKERKRHKRKRDLIESVSWELCEKFIDQKLNRENMEEIGNITFMACQQHASDIRKIYSMPFDKSSIAFVEDLSHHLMNDCEVFNYIAKTE